MKKILILLLALLLVVTTGARECLQLEDDGTDCDIITLAINNSNKVLYDSQVCNITTYTPSGTVDDNEVLMTNGTKGEGIHDFTFNKATSGIWNYKIMCKGPELLPSINFGTITIDESIPSRLNELNDSNYDIKEGIILNHSNTQNLISGYITTSEGVIEQSIDGNQSETETRGDIAWITADISSLSLYSQVSIINTTTLDIQQSIKGNSSAWANTTSTGNVTISAGDITWIGSEAANATFAQKLNSTSWIADRWTLPWMVYQIYRFP